MFYSRGQQPNNFGNHWWRRAGSDPSLYVSSWGCTHSNPKSKFPQLLQCPFVLTPKTIHLTKPSFFNVCNSYIKAKTTYNVVLLMVSEQKVSVPISDSSARNYHLTANSKQQYSGSRAARIFLFFSFHIILENNRKITENIYLVKKLLLSDFTMQFLAWF